MVFVVDYGFFLRSQYVYKYFFILDKYYIILFEDFGIFGLVCLLYFCCKGYSLGFQYKDIWEKLKKEDIFLCFGYDFNFNFCCML